MCKNEIFELKHEQKGVRLYMPVCLVKCEPLPYLQHLGILTSGEPTNYHLYNSS